MRSEEADTSFRRRRSCWVSRIAGSSTVVDKVMVFVERIGFLTYHILSPQMARSHLWFLAQTTNGSEPSVVFDEPFVDSGSHLWSLMSHLWNINDTIRSTSVEYSTDIVPLVTDA